MKNPQGVMKLWRIVVAVYALMIMGLALRVGPMFGDDMRYRHYDFSNMEVVIDFSFLACLIVAAVLLLGSVAGGESPPRAGTLAIIAGILTLPLGGLAIFAGTRIRAAVNAIKTDQILANVPGSRQSSVV